MFDSIAKLIGIFVITFCFIYGISIVLGGYKLKHLNCTFIKESSFMKMVFLDDEGDIAKKGAYFTKDDLITLKTRVEYVIEHFNDIDYKEPTGLYKNES